MRRSSGRANRSQFRPAWQRAPAGSDRDSRPSCRSSSASCAARCPGCCCIRGGSARAACPAAAAIPGRSAAMRKVSSPFSRRLPVTQPGWPAAPCRVKARARIKFVFSWLVLLLVFFLLVVGVLLHPLLNPFCLLLFLNAGLGCSECSVVPRQMARIAHVHRFLVLVVSDLDQVLVGRGVLVMAGQARYLFAGTRVGVIGHRMHAHRVAELPGR